ncbi:ankyrin repeat-containing domain protein [Dactylonectria estremocensis]|uniref:Ankyrin repeat-containing domain protein n=1 Tax=Dactylonectria estremocensis TaxID=1079267 RepID=A0A9P9IBS3_9HYPO|nr:ankyrin repeat-containing domain protein [Dactylonectria estremocensis]
MLLEIHQVDVEAKDEAGRTPLFKATQAGSFDVVKHLLLLGKAVPDSSDSEDNTTPLSWAAEDGHLAMAKLLIDTGNVKINSKDVNNRTPLFLAASNGHGGIVKLLLETEAVDVNVRDSDGQTPLFAAALGGSRSIVKMLLDTGKADINTKEERRWLVLSGRAMTWWSRCFTTSGSTTVSHLRHRLPIEGMGR